MNIFLSIFQHITYGNQLSVQFWKRWKKLNELNISSRFNYAIQLKSTLRYWMKSNFLSILQFSQLS